MYWKYFKYILEHKKNVFVECWREGLYLHAFTHDLSKFLPSEFIHYAKNFYSEKSCKRCKHYLKCDYNQLGLGSGKWAIQCVDYNYEQFNKAWEHHYKHNKHHWNYWIGKDMPFKYIKQMICDWKGMSRKFGDTPQEFYMNNYDKIQLTLNSRLELELELGLIDSVCLISNVTWRDYCERNKITMREDLIRLRYLV